MDFGFELVAAKPKGAVVDPPTQQSMRGGVKTPRNPSTDQKKIRHQLARQGSLDVIARLTQSLASGAADWVSRDQQVTARFERQGDQLAVDVAHPEGFESRRFAVVATAEAFRWVASFDVEQPHYAEVADRKVLADARQTLVPRHTPLSPAEEAARYGQELADEAESAEQKRWEDWEDEARFGSAGPSANGIDDAYEQFATQVPQPDTGFDVPGVSTRSDALTMNDGDWTAAAGRRTAALGWDFIDGLSADEQVALVATMGFAHPADLSDADWSALMSDPAAQAWASSYQGRYAALSSKTIDAFRQIVTDHSAKMVDGVFIDVQSANAICTVYDALGDANKAKFMSMPVAQLGPAAWKLISKASRRTASSTRPGAGDVAVVVADGYYAGKIGQRAVFEPGLYGEGSLAICFGASAFRPEDGSYVSCSGGPLPEVFMEDLRHAGKTTQRFWKWGPGGSFAGNGVEYTAEVDLWEWTPPKSVR